MLTSLGPLFTAIIAFCSVFGALGLLFRMLLNPVKSNIERMQSDIETLKKGQDDLKGNIQEIKNLLNGQSHKAYDK